MSGDLWSDVNLRELAATTRWSLKHLLGLRDRLPPEFPYGPREVTRLADAMNIGADRAAAILGRVSGVPLKPVGSAALAPPDVAVWGWCPTCGATLSRLVRSDEVGAWCGGCGCDIGLEARPSERWWPDGESCKARVVD